MSSRLRLALRVIVIAIPLVGLALVLALRPGLWELHIVFSSPKVAAHGFLTISLGGAFLYGIAPILRATEVKALYPVATALGLAFAYVGFYLALRE